MSENCGGMMADSNPPPFHAVLDSCYIIDWLEDNPERKDDADAVNELMERTFRKEVTLAVSAAAVAEVFPARNRDQERYALLREMYAHPAFRVLPVDAAVAEKAAYLREELNITGKSRALDMIHLSTAIHWCVPYFYTKDDKMLNLNERVAKLPEHGPDDKFEICKIRRTRLPGV